MNDKELAEAIISFHCWHEAAMDVLYQHNGRPWEPERYQQLAKWRDEEATKIEAHFGREMFGRLAQNSEEPMP